MVLLATFNGEAFIKAQIESILAQSWDDIRIVIRDDGSTDKTTEIIEMYLQNNHNMTLVKDGLSGGSAAKNFITLIESLNLVPDEVVFLCDQDDIWLEGKIAVAMRHICSGVDLYSSALMTFETESDKRHIIKSKFKPKKFDHLFQGLSAGCTYAMSYKLVKIIKERLKLDRWYFENNFSHDWLIYTLARVNNLKIFHDKVPKILYRQHANNVQGSLVGIPGVVYRLQNISAPWYIGQILKNHEFFERNSDELQVIEAVKNRRYFYLLMRIFQLRRSKIQCLILYAFLVTRNANVSEIC